MLIIANVATAQKITYDFKKGTYVNPIPKVKYGDDVTLELQNFNRFLYKVNIKTQKWDLATPVPAQFSALFDLKVDSAKEGTKEAIELMTNLLVEHSTKDDLFKALDTLVFRCKSYQKAIDFIDVDLFNLKTLENFTNQDFDSQEMMEKAFLVLEKEMQNSSYSKTNTVNYDNFKNAYLNAEEFYASAANEAKKNKELNNLKIIEKAAKLFNDNYYKIKTAFEEIEIKQTELVNLIKNPNSFRVTSYPFQADADELIFDVKIAPKDSAFSSTPSFSKKINTHGGLKIAFSVGPMFSFGNNANDNIAFIKPDSVNIDFRSTDNIIKPSVSAMMHLLYRSSSDFSPGIMFGIGADFKDIKTLNTNFAIGLTAALGRKDKVFASVGWNFVQVRRKKESVNLIIKKAANINQDDFTQVVFRHTPFISFTYVIGSKIAK